MCYTRDKMEEFAVDNPTFEDENINDEHQMKDASVSSREEKDIVSRTIESFWISMENIYEKHKKVVSLAISVIVVILFLAYFLGAIHYRIKYYECQDQHCNWKWCTGHGFLIIITSAVIVGVLYFQILKRCFGSTIKRIVWIPINKVSSDCWKFRFIRTFVYVIPVALIIMYLALDTAGDRRRLISLLGLGVLLILGAVFSKHPGKIKWKPVLCGLLLQFLFGLFTLKWEVGKQIFSCFGEKTSTFLNYTSAGSSFVYGEDLASSVFAFQVLPVIFFFSFFVQILYYWGVMQWVVMKLGWLLQITMGTTVCESVNTSASIFLGQSEAPLLIKPYVKDLTKSEIHAIMTSGFATVSGTVLAAYISFGVDASHLLTASIMSAPASLCYSKLFYPENEESKTKVDNIHIVKGDETGVLDAATKGAMSGISLVLGIIANLVAFVSAIKFLDGVVGWMGELIGLTDENAISFSYILTKIFYPLVWLMGVRSEHCSDVAKVVALKTVVNEFVAYEELGNLIKENKVYGRSQIIATYALCGFSNPSSIGIMIGALSSLAPDRRSDIAEVSFRAFLSGCAVCFLTACVAGILSGDLDESSEV